MIEGGGIGEREGGREGAENISCFSSSFASCNISITAVAFPAVRPRRLTYLLEAGGQRASLSLHRRTAVVLAAASV